MVDPASVPEAFEVNARTADGVVMAIRHRSRPHYGIQFHPESIMTTEGKAMLANFLEIVRTADPVSAAQRTVVE